MHRVDRLCTQIAPKATTATQADIESFQPKKLRELAKQQNYGRLTLNIVDELKVCVHDPEKQILVDFDLLRAVEKDNLDLYDEQAYERAISQKHAHDRSHCDPVPALCVVFPSTTEETAELVKVCQKHRIPIQPSGTRTGLEGSSIPIVPGVTFDMARYMNKIIDIYPNEQLVEVECGVEKIKLQRYLKERGYYFPVDPGSNACLGGYASTNGSGTFINSNMQTYTRALTVVTANGEIMRTRSRAVKTSAGMNLHGLIVGSEGSLCLVTRLLLVIKPLPKVTLSCRVQFPTTLDATNFVVKMKTSGLQSLTRCEFLNEEAMFAVNQYSKTDYEVKPTLILECHLTSTQEVEPAEEHIKKIGSETNYTSYIATADEKEYEQLWAARKDALFAAYKLYKCPPQCGNTNKKPRIAVFVTDVCVPLPNLPAVITQTENDYHAEGFPCIIAAHIADGNYHCFIPHDTNDAKQVDILNKLNAKMIQNAIQNGGSSTGEHGTGLVRMPFLEEERGPTAMHWMRAIKGALDPNALMNPYKVFTPNICEHHKPVSHHE